MKRRRLRERLAGQACLWPDHCPHCLYPTGSEPAIEAAGFCSNCLRALNGGKRRMSRIEAFRLRSAYAAKAAPQLAQNFDPA
jgi:hypothetical protein